MSSLRRCLGRRWLALLASATPALAAADCALPSRVFPIAGVTATIEIADNCELELVLRKRGRNAFSELPKGTKITRFNGAPITSGTLAGKITSLTAEFSEGKRTRVRECIYDELWRCTAAK